MPPNVLGIDVDDYKDKPGAAVLDALQEQHGPLPPTWTSSSRGGRSGIRFYRVPEGLRWPGVLGPGIETIRFDHRYAVAWPSLHPEGGTYRWTQPDGSIALEAIPTVDELPALPHTWVEALTGGLLSTDQPRADLRRTEIDSWLYGHEQGAPCRVMSTVLERGLSALQSGTSRHDAALALTNRLCWLAGEGHTGVESTLARACFHFTKVTADRFERGEWDRMVDGAVRLSAAAHPNPQPDPCNTPWAGILKEQPAWAPSTSATKPWITSDALPTHSNDSPSSPTPYAETATTQRSDTNASVALDAVALDSLQPDRTSWWPRHPDHDPFAGLIPKGTTPWTALSPRTAATEHGSRLSTQASAMPKPSNASPTPSNASPTDSKQPATNVSTEKQPTTPQAASRQDATAEDSSTATDRTSWWPRHPDHALNPDNDEPGPTILQRDDGQNLFYPGRINGLIAPSESGKTWIALHAVTQTVHQGLNATILDFEDTHRGVTARLQALGLTDTQIRDHVAYIGPDEPLSLMYPTGRDLTEHLNTWNPAVIILDGVNAAMGIHGLDLISNKDATTFAQHVLRPLTTTGACVIYVDHTPKDKDSTSAGGIGAQAKRAMTTGCAIRVHVNKQFGKGQNGTLTLNVDKDRQGDVRGASKPSGEGGHWAGTAQLTSHDDGTVSIVVQSPDTRIEHRQDAPAFKPTVYMTRVSEYIEANPGQGHNLIVGAVRGDTHRVKDALRHLTDEGWVKVEKEGQKSRYYTVKPYSELLETPQNTTEGDRGWTEGEPRVAPSVKNRGWLGVDNPDVVGGPTTPGSGSNTPNGVNGKTTPGSDRIVPRILNGVDTVWVDLDTGTVYDTEEDAQT
jgi:hypothetical protein